MTGPAYLTDPNFDPNAPVCSGDVADLIAGLQSARYPWYYPQKAKGLQVDTFDYGCEFLPLTAGDTDNRSINIDSDAAFLIGEAMIEVRSADNLIVYPVPPLLIDLKDSGSGRVLSNIPVAASSYFGTAQRPAIWKLPKIISPNSTLMVEVQNLVAIDFNIRINFHGIKIFEYVPTKNDSLGM